MATEPQTYVSDMRPRFEPFVIDCGKIAAYRYSGSLRSELESKTLTTAEAIAILEDMLIIREFEEMIVKLRSGAYDPIGDFNYRGPTHVSVGQEGTAAGACSALLITDNITSTHRGHGESLAKGTVALRSMDEEGLRARMPACRANSREELLEAALEEHIYRTICELFGKDDGYCRGRGGSMHIADFHGRPSRRQRHRRRRRADRHRRGPGQPLLRATRRWCAVSPGTALMPTASCSNR